MLKFTLFDPEMRTYQTERKCFMSGMDWLLIGEIAPLQELASKYIPLLDDEEALFEWEFINQKTMTHYTFTLSYEIPECFDRDE